MGDRSPVRAASVSHPHQERSPSTPSSLGVSSQSASPVSAPRCSGSPSKVPPGRRYEKWSFIGYPLSTLVDGWAQSARHVWHQWWWIGHVVQLHRAFLGDLADHDAAPHVHIADQHVPQGQGSSEGRDAADAKPDGDRARDASVPPLSRTSPGSSCSTSTHARCVAVAPRCAPPMPRASRSILARSCSRPAPSWPHREPRPTQSPTRSEDKEITVPANNLFDRITAEETLGVHDV